jgi:hypothetical protein
MNLTIINSRIFLFCLLATLTVSLSPLEAKAQHYEYAFNSIDKYARSVPYYYTNDPQTLVNYLVKPAKNEWQKVRAIFIWITDNISYDVYSYNNNNVTFEKCKAMNVFFTRKGVCSGYANLFMFLCGFAEIDCSVVEGYAKGVGHYYGKVFSETNHAWNAIEIDGQMHLFDATWASGYYDNGSFYKKFNEFWWDTPPTKFITTHFAEDRNFNYLNYTVSKREFELMAQVLENPKSYPKQNFQDNKIIKQYSNGISNNQYSQSYSYIQPYDNKNYKYEVNMPKMNHTSLSIGICVAGVTDSFEGFRSGKMDYQLSGQLGGYVGEKGHGRSFWGVFPSVDLTDGYPFALECGTVLSRFLKFSAGGRMLPNDKSNWTDYTFAPSATVGIQLHLGAFYVAVDMNGYYFNSKTVNRFIASAGFCI